MTDRRDDAPQTPATQGFATAGAAADATNRDARAENPDAPAATGDAGRTGDAARRAGDRTPDGRDDGERAREGAPGAGMAGAEAAGDRAAGDRAAGGGAAGGGFGGDVSPDQHRPGGDGHDGGPYGDDGHGDDGPPTSLPGKNAARGGDVLAGAAAPLPRGLVGEILLPGSQAEQARQEAKVRRGFFPTLKRALRHIPFSQDVVASYYCALDPKTPPASRGILLAALAYFVLPIDVIPDFVAGLGFTDDMAVLLAAFSAVRNNIRPEHYDKARDVLKPEAEAPAGTGEAQGA